MFNIVRSVEVPASLMKEKPKYNAPDVLSALEAMSYSKCYICEVLEPLSIAVEHFDANGSRFDWHNLYLACHRCNSNIKLANYNNLIDPCAPNTDAVRAIAHDIPKSPNTKIGIRAQNSATSTKETVELLDKVFNDDNTANRRITRKYIRKKVYKVASKFLKEIDVYTDSDTPPHKRDEAGKQIIHYLRCEQEFSAFLRWVILDDEELKLTFEQYIV